MNQMKLVSGEALIAAKKIAASSEKYKKELSNRKTNLNVLQKNLTTKESEIQRITQEVKKLQQKVNTSSNNGTKPVNTSQLNQAGQKLQNMQTNRNKIKQELLNVQMELATARKSLKNLEDQRTANSSNNNGKNENNMKNGTIAPPSTPAPPPASRGWLTVPKWSDFSGKSKTSNKKANAAAEKVKAAANRQRAFNNLLRQSTNATNDNKT